jgi:hypothetical protein
MDGEGYSCQESDVIEFIDSGDSGSGGGGGGNGGGGECAYMVGLGIFVPLLSRVVFSCSEEFLDRWSPDGLVVFFFFVMFYYHLK